MESWLLFLLEFLRAEALKRPPHLFQNYLPSQDGMTHNQFIKIMIIFSIAFITVLILKVYMFKCVWRCYRLMKCTNSAEERSGSKMLQKVVLPSYEEAVSLPYKVPEGGPAPPPYSEV